MAEKKRPAPMKTPIIQSARPGTAPPSGYTSAIHRSSDSKERRPIKTGHTAQTSERFVEWLLLLVFCGFLFAHTLPRAWKTLNTDFPNYYLAAKLQREGFDTSRAYEWRWLERQKDHQNIDRPLIGLAPITPFSTLAVWPLSGLPPLTAKHVWTVFQLALLLPIALALQKISGEPYRRIGLLIFACFPLHRNLEYGQYYILLLAMLVGACVAHQRGRTALAGALIALASATKIFPIIFLLYFLRRREWRAICAALLTGTATALISVQFFGWSMHRTYLNSVLPWTLRGEVLPPYVLSSSSISSLLHRLFLYEPQWNPHPWHSSPAMYAVLQPLLQMLVLAPALLLVQPASTAPRRIALEWCALLTATLAISTVPASYNFTLLIFPVVVLYGFLRPRRRIASLVVLLLFFGIGNPGWKILSVEGLGVLLNVPRLYLLMLFTGALYWSLRRAAPLSPSPSRTSTLRWCGSLAMLCVLSIVSGLRHQRGLFADYPYRVPERSDVLMASAPAMADKSIATVAMLPGGYHLIGVPALTTGAKDELSFAAASKEIWIEKVGHTSRLVSVSQPRVPAIEQAQSPALSLDGQQLAYLREAKGRGRLYVQAKANQQVPDLAWTPEWMNVEEAVFLPDASLVVAAAQPRGGSQLYQFRAPMSGVTMDLGDARYPAASPDGRWLAYSILSSGSWNLWLLDRVTGDKRRLTDAACNQIESFWEADSKTLLYASDCGRALGFTAICQRRVIP